MGSYVLVGSHDPFESTDGRQLYELATMLTDNREEVTVFLTQNGVLPCRSASAAAPEVALAASRATVVADDFALRERAITTGELVPGVRIGGVDALLDAVTSDGAKVIWF
jgi:sulfur relay (sulfurtransferase) complex TusBCD TusD component (DsrE family)